MKFKIERFEGDDSLRFSGEVSGMDVARLNLSPLDRALLRDFSAEPADILLTLEMLFRRNAENSSSKC